jgi:hypothetical protein
MMAPTLRLLPQDSLPAASGAQPAHAKHDACIVDNTQQAASINSAQHNTQAAAP